MKNLLRALGNYLKFLEAPRRDAGKFTIPDDEKITMFEQLIEKSNKLGTAQEISPRKEFVQTSQNRIFNKLMESPNLQVRPKQRRTPRRSLRRTFIASPAFAIILLLVLGFGFVGSVQAADATIPGDFFYPLDLAIEKAQFQLATNDPDRIQLVLNFADERLGEARITFSEGDFGSTELALANYGQNLRIVRNLILNASDEMQGDLILVLAAHNLNQEKILQQLLSAASLETQEIILQTISILQHVLLEIEDLPEAAGVDFISNPHFKFAVDDLNNPKYEETSSEETSTEGSQDSSNGDWLPPGIIDNPGLDDDLPPGLKDKDKPPGQDDDKDKEKGTGN